jgi:hypothetical protein
MTVRLSSAIIQEEEYDMLEEWSRLLESDCFVDTRLVGADGSVDIHRWAPTAASGVNPYLCRCSSRIFIFIYNEENCDSGSDPLALELLSSFLDPEPFFHNADLDLVPDVAAGQVFMFRILSL